MFGIGQSLRRKPRQFSYNPRYYDAEQEARNQRRIELGHAPKEEEGRERKPGDLLRARSERRQFVVLLVVGVVMLTKSIIETFNF